MMLIPNGQPVHTIAYTRIPLIDGAGEKWTMRIYWNRVVYYPLYGNAAGREYRANLLGSEIRDSVVNTWTRGTTEKATVTVFLPESGCREEVFIGDTEVQNRLLTEFLDHKQKDDGLLHRH